MQLSLSEIANYKNHHVFKRYQQDYPNNKLSAETAFTELVKYLWLAQKHAEDKHRHPNDKDLHFTCGIHYEMSEIDDMWHTFILFTKDYAEFCDKFFGTFIHHDPTTEDEEGKITEFTEDFSRYLNYIDKHLGEKTLKIWFSSLL